MRFIKNNFAYIILGVVAIALIFVTINLQVRLSSAPESSGAEGGFLATIQNQLRTLTALVAPPNEAGDSLKDGTQASADEQVAVDTVGEGVTAATLIDTTTDESESPERGTLAAGGSGLSIAEPDPLRLSATAAALYNAENLTVSEDDQILAAIIGRDSRAVGFFGYAYYLANQDTLRTIAIRLPDGQLVGPNATSAANGLYPLARPLYLYSSPTVLKENLAVERFIGCYLNQLPQAVHDVGYLLPSRTLFAQALQAFDASCQECRRTSTADHPLAATVPVCDATGSDNAEIVVVGSSTVKPLTDRMARLFTERGFRGTIDIDGSGSGAGFRDFCTVGRGDIVDASRAVRAEERASCTEIDRALVPFPVAVDALAVVVSAENSFATEASIEELQQIFAYARTWSDINPAWPNEPIIRAIPGAQRGTFDYFVEAVMEGAALQNLAALQANPLAADSALDAEAAVSTPTSTPIGSGAYLNNSPEVRLGYVATDPVCVANTTLLSLLLENKYGLQVAMTEFTDSERLFQALSDKDPATRLDLTACYRDPDDRTVRQKYFSYTDFIGSGYLINEGTRYVLVTPHALKAPLERSNTCLYRFLSRMNWNEVVSNSTLWSEQDMTSWYQQNLPLIDSWTNCD